MAKASEFFNTQDGNEQTRKEVCYNCKHIDRPAGDKPFQADLNQSVYCEILQRFVEMIKSNSCGSFEFYIR
jgi:hypothetical protein